MKALRNILNMILNVLAGGSFLIMTALTCWQVFTPRSCPVIPLPRI